MLNSTSNSLWDIKGASIEAARTDTSSKNKKPLWSGEHLADLKDHDAMSISNLAAPAPNVGLGN